MNALVIGGCRGIGRAISVRLAKDGYDILATARSDGPNAQETRTAVQAQGRTFTLVTLDVTDAAGARTALEPYLEGDALPEVVVYNAGIAKDSLFALMPPAQWNDVIRTNLDGFYNTVRPLLFGMLGRRRGRIVVISSVSGQIGQAGQVNYSASKAALIGAAKALAREVGKRGILVNVVAPGVIDTEMTRDMPLEHVLPMIPLQRIGTVDEVAGAVSFLAGPDSTYIQGQVIAVNGGLAM